MMQSNGFFICDNRSITREQSKTCIDHLHTNNLVQNITINYVPFNSLDHKIMVIEIEKNMYHKNILKTYDIKSVNYAVLKEKFKEIKINNITNVDSMYNEFIDKIESAILHSTLTKNIKSKTTFLNKPWTDSELFQT